MFAFSGLRMGASLRISIVCFDCAILRVKSTVCFWPSAEDTASFCSDSKPAASTLTEYVPGFSCAKLNRPEISVLALRFSPVSLFVIVTVARGTPAPVASLTWPMIALVVSPCEKVTSGKRKWNDPTKTNINNIERSMVVDSSSPLLIVNHT